MILTFSNISRSFSRPRKIWSFNVIDLQRMAKKCTKNYDARDAAIGLLINYFVQRRCRCRYCRGLVNTLVLNREWYGEN